MPAWLQNILMSEWIGWMATASFTASYLVRKEIQLLWVQAFASSLWLVYGWAHNAMPMVIANAIVVSAAAMKALRLRAADKKSSIL